VHERRRLQSLTHWFLRQHAGRQTPQILVNQRQQLLESVIIAAHDCVQRLSDFAHTFEVTTAATGLQTAAGQPQFRERRAVNLKLLNILACWIAWQIGTNKSSRWRGVKRLFSQHHPRHVRNLGAGRH
jgi:hypothetical protein